MFIIGSHLSISKGYLHMGKEATKIGGNTFQYFTRNPRGGSMRALDVDDMNSLKLTRLTRIILVQQKKICALLQNKP